MEGSGYLILIYIIYGTISVALTYWLARTLSQNGALFLEDVFEERPGLAHSVNRLLVVGFYMLNLGYAFLILRSNHDVGALDAVELLIAKLGLLLVSLGVMHFINMALFWRIRRRHLEPTLSPVSPQAFVNPGTEEWQPWTAAQH